MKKQSIFFAVGVCMACIAVVSGPTPVGAQSIVDSLSVKSEGRISVFQSDALKRMMECDTAASAGVQTHSPGLSEGLKSGTRVLHKVGYRIQVYSDNKQGTAKSNVQRIASEISEVYPLIGTYPAYKAPFWRLKVGDFSSRQEAVAMMSELKKSFPSLAGEMIVVRDRINVIE